MMNPTSIADVGSTLGGGVVGLSLLSTVNWANVPYGECVKVGVSLVIMVLGYLAYNSKKAGK